MPGTMYLNLQRSWNWKIAAYLFLAGVGAGSSFVGTVAHLFSPSLVQLVRVGLFVGIPLVVVGIMFLVWDLGKPTRFINALQSPGTSWIARGSWIITSFIAVSAVVFGLWIWPFTLLEGYPEALFLLEILVVVFSCGTIIYTGLLLGASKPIPFWSMPTLPLLFAVSATATGMNATALVLVLGNLVPAASEVALTLVRYIPVLITAEIAVLVLHLWGTHQTVTAKYSTVQILRGRFAAQFWVGYVILGLETPLVAEMLSLRLAAGAELFFVVLASILGLVGGFLLRLIVVSAGTKTPMSVAGGVFAIPSNM
jgi:formate-dependent nitrite reductase membrane component NrfD